MDTVDLSVHTITWHHLCEGIRGVAELLLRDRFSQGHLGLGSMALSNRMRDANATSYMNPKWQSVQFQRSINDKILLTVIF